MAVLQRTCIGCHQVRARENLIRIVRNPADGTITPDPRGKGRGAYVCPSMDCINRATQIQNLNRAFRISPDSEHCISSKAMDKLKQDLLKLIEVQHH